MPDLTIYKLIISENQPFELLKLRFQEKLTSLNTASRLLPKGVYTTFRTYEGNKLLPLEHHLTRLESSAALLGEKIHLDEKLIHEAVKEALKEYQPLDTRIRLTVGLEDIQEELFISIEPLVSPSQKDYQMGVKTVTFHLHREIPEAKQTSFISIAEQIRKRLPAGCHEGLLVDEQGYILEGLSSNFFFVRQQTLFTAPSGVLSGITRSLVLAAAHSQGIPVIFQAAKLIEILTFEEAFITSSTRSILPVVKINNHIIGNGDIGPFTKILSRAYWNEIKSRLTDN
jgi:branched-chain amino acid aminotransferase